MLTPTLSAECCSFLLPRSSSAPPLSAEEHEMSKGCPSDLVHAVRFTSQQHVSIVTFTVVACGNTLSNTVPAIGIISKCVSSHQRVCLIIAVVQ